MYRSIRVGWTLWLTSLAVLFAWPALYMQLPGVSDLVVIAIGAGGVCARPDCAPEPWLVMEWGSPSSRPWLCLALALGVAVPLLWHWRRVRWLDPVVRREPAVEFGSDRVGYRTRPPYTITTDVHASRLRLRAFVWRLVLAMAFGTWVFLELSMPRFIKNQGCVAWETFAVPEYLTYVVAFLALICAHMPTRRRVFGTRSDASRSSRAAMPMPRTRVP